ncbi:arabinogalactan oligomer/maltooligosaccharide transport system permease protein [Conyzicola lurida]|uniref:Maltose/maltodextrin transport system permease protein n=1 Tax=Conyzicola lurida TaxID=1172621 RepID=A0A841APS6_9MICO|nr:ABC transporter permease subunit [Conyzicola lurida]MBB5843706.1 arabinogalactan oligomer/maltooligosaccharide transport system permease protein [Conyzicola lurida]
MTQLAGAPGTTPAPPAPAVRRREKAPLSLSGILIKIIALSVLNAIGVYALFVLFVAGSWLVFGLGVATLLVLDWIYLSRRALPAKYLAPGVFFLVIFQIFVVVYTGYIAFTNYGDGHNSTKDDAINAIVAKSLVRVEDSPAYQLTVVQQLGTFSFLVTDPDGEVSLGGEGRPLEEVDSDGTSLDGYETLSFNDILNNQEAISAISVPLTDNPSDGALRTPDGTSAFLYESTLLYDEASDSFTDQATGTVYSDAGNGEFASAEGEALTPGWTITVGFDNFVRAVTDESIRGPLLGVVLWTFAFAFLSVATTFALGLFLAIVFNDSRMRGRKVYRVLAILPYAFPSFLSALVWAGLLNPQFGFVNNVLLGGADVPWLTDPTLAKISILFVNLWLGFPYMFLVCTGALQAIPDDVIEAARVDGARNWGIFRLIKLPLLMVSLAPLLISSFAFNFNNFNLIYMLTAGGPRDISAGVNVGATDILITLVYKVAFGAVAGRDYGLASAFAIIIFIVVATVSIIGYRRTRVLEDIN